MNNNYYDNSLDRCINTKDFYNPENKSKVNSYNLESYTDTNYYQIKETKAKINVYIRKTN